MSKNKQTISIGGQALIEGIMMKGPKKTVIAVREPNGNIHIEDMKETHARDKFKFLGLPLLRGAVNLIESMISGYKALMFSADKSGMTDLEEEEDRKKADEKRRKKAERLAAKSGEAAEVVYARLEEKDKKKNEDGALMAVLMMVASVLGVALALFLFMWLPAFLFDTIDGLAAADLSKFRALIEGVVKMIIFVGYMALVTLMEDIKRVFMYHGAEHKTIFCFEAGEPLTVENVRKQKRFHPRCGTSFTILMLIVSILFYALLSILFPALTKIRLLWVGIKIIALPIMCGIGYELIRFCGKHDNLLTRIISAPGMWLQHLTTKEPDDEMIEVAIKSIEAVLPDDPKGEADACSCES